MPISRKKESVLYGFGAYELMRILHELHGRGYQKLRWMSYMAPTGMSLRCHITTQDHIRANEYILFDDKEEEVWYTSVHAMTTG